MKKLKVAIIGSGNIGTDLMYKIERCDHLEMSVMVGIDPQSEGLARAKDRGYLIIENGIDGLLEHPEKFDIVFDATTAKAHKEHTEKVEALGKRMIDLTPAAIGPYVIPAANLSQHLEKSNVNMVTCGGQATIPIVYAINEVVPLDYAEIVATVASKSAGPGTRANIDEFTQTTANAIERIGGAKKGKAIIILNPAVPPIMMRDTIHVLTSEPGHEEAITEAIYAMVKKVQEYVPGYHLKNRPIIDGNRVTVTVEIEGAGDFFPPYSGNLDIMTAAAAKVAEEMAKSLVATT
ncbi:acetaldehyde dehydrogenase (acetylating) [Lysinibacillus yapensis]|uniref:Acetaldehyde dehydrogenase n=1 Tax=Ureibacillus yapensis TaxID=2304605 RepID=A0A396SCZ9_9BACL|nr:acetaldehyde dehydrogenase (acetylating) [Lysinibacillus yapensis]RHW39476.1 acetaldehyde dehydrogenase (acetylating) [Lysinibacillus yapensis]